MLLVKVLLSLFFIGGVYANAADETNVDVIHVHEHRTQHNGHKHDKHKHNEHKHNEHKHNEHKHDDHKHEHNEHKHAQHRHDAHVHGAGKAYVIQDDQMWQIELVLPARDVLGFESVAQTSEQINAIDRFAQVFDQQSHLVIQFPNCTVLSASHNLDDFRPTSSVLTETVHMEHSDVEVAFVYTCSKAPPYLQMSVFKLLESLESVRTQMVYAKGQTMVEFTSREHRFALK